MSKPHSKHKSKHKSKYKCKHASLHVERCEERRLMASISGYVWGDINASKSFDAGFESRLSGWQVFIDANKNARLDPGETTQTTDRRGNYRFSNLPAGETVIGQTLRSGFGQTFPGRQGAQGSNFNIDVVFPDDSLTPAQQSVFETAAARWEQLIIGDLPDFNSIAAGRVVDDLVIEARLLNIDGPGETLGQATFTERRPDSQGGLPTFGFMEFDTADYPSSSANDDDFKAVVLHEMAHVLGFGTLWEDENLLVGGQTTSPTFTGTNATREYNRIFGGVESGVPVEAGGGDGTQNSHWSKDVFGPELMTGFQSPGFTIISSVTVGQFADLGYLVNLGLADAFSPTLAGASLSLPGRDGFFNNAPRQTVRVLSPSAVTNVEAPALTSFSHTLDLTSGEVRTGVNFGVIRNRNPGIDNVELSPTFQTIGSGIRVRANGLTTFNDVAAPNTNTIDQVQFYRESNGTAGLQAPGDAGLTSNFDTLIGTDTDGFNGGWAVTARTSNLSAGSVQFYALAFDRYDFKARDSASGRLIAGAQTVPSSPSTVIARGTSATSANVSFRDNSNNEVGYRVQFSTDSRFRRNILTREVLATDSQLAGTGTRSVNVSGLAAGTEYFVRVSTFNTAGSSSFANANVVTLSPGEVIVDNTDPAARRVGNWSAEDAGTGFLGINYFIYDGPSVGIAAAVTADRPPTPSVRYEPALVDRRNYFVFARRLPGLESGIPEFDAIINTPVTYQVRTGDRAIKNLTVTRNTPTLPGGWVLLGRFENSGARKLSVRTLGTDVFVVSDAVRFLPTGPVSTSVSTSSSGASGASLKAARPIQGTLFSSSPIPMGPNRPDKNDLLA